MNTEETKQTCTNCKYFQRFYIIGPSGAFRPTLEGRCMCSKINNKLLAKHVKRNEGCDLWQPYELQKLNIQYCMQERVERIYKYVKEILTILRDME